MDILTTQHHISQADIVPNNWIYFLKLGSNFCRIYTVMTIGESDTPLDVLLTILVHLRQPRKHSSSNGWISLQHIITFPGLNWCPKFEDFTWNLKVLICRKDTMVNKMGVKYTFRGSSGHCHISKGGDTTLNQQVMHVLTIQCHMVCADLVLKIGYSA